REDGAQVRPLRRDLDDLDRELALAAHLRQHGGGRRLPARRVLPRGPDEALCDIDELALLDPVEDASLDVGHRGHQVVPSRSTARARRSTPTAIRSGDVVAKQIRNASGNRLLGENALPGMIATPSASATGKRASVSTAGSKVTHRKN